MTYVTSYMKKELSNHVLELALGNSPEAIAHRMVKPGTNIYSAYLSEVANRICIAGDICLGGNENGIVSNVGYRLAWFAGQLSECYLCEKFLRREWQWEAAIEQIHWQIQASEREAKIPLTDLDCLRRQEFGADPDWWIENSDKLREFIKNPEWKYDSPNVTEFYEFMETLGDVDDLPGYDYPRIQAGWLCAIQQRYAELRTRSCL